MTKYILIQSPDTTDFDTEELNKNIGGDIKVTGLIYEKIETSSLETLEQHFSKLKARENGINIDNYPF